MGEFKGFADVVRSNLDQEIYDTDRQHLETEIRYYERLDKWAAKVFAWANRQDKESLAKRFVNDWYMQQVTLHERDALNLRSLIYEELMDRHHQARRQGIAAKLANDPKQGAKSSALKLWQDWQSRKTLHKSGAAFARFVCDKYPVLENPTTVERWARKWAAEKREK